MNSTLLSVIIPVYNCAPVITRCIDSIDYPAAEIIVVDDGSTDNSADVVRRYIENHPNVRLIQKENGGVSSARNVGIEEASGKYIMFVDADDYLASDGIDKILKIAEENDADVVKYKIEFLSNNSKQDIPSLSDWFISYEIICGKGQSLLRNDISDYHVFDACFRRDLIINCHVRFHTDLSLHEDDVFMGELLCCCGKVISTDLPLYHYIRASNYSSTHNQSIEKQRKLIDSGYLAIGYRSSSVEQYCPEALPLERLKYMRWVCTPKKAKMAKYSLREYKKILGKFKNYNCWPLDYRWFRIARLDWSWKVRLKNVVKTFLCNHPNLGYIFPYNNK